LEFPAYTRDPSLTSDFLKRDIKRSDSFDENEKDRVLASLLQSKDPADLHAANMLIKEIFTGDSIIDQDDTKVKRDLEIVTENIKVFNELLDVYTPNDGPITEQEMIVEIYDALKIMKSKLASLCGDLEEEEDTEGVLPVYENFTRALFRYKDMVKEFEHVKSSSNKPLIDLLDFESSNKNGESGALESTGNTLLDSDLNSLFSSASTGNNSNNNTTATTTPEVPPNSLPQADLNDLFINLNVSTIASRVSDNIIANLNTSNNPDTNNSSANAFPIPAFSDSLVGSPAPNRAFIPSNDLPSTTLFRKGDIEVKIVFESLAPELGQGSQSTTNVLECNILYLNHGIDPIHNINFLAAVPKTMKVKLRPPSTTTIPASAEFGSPSIVYQNMMIANPTRAFIRLKYKFMYTKNGKDFDVQDTTSSFPRS